MSSQLLWESAPPEPEILEDFDTTSLDLSSTIPPTPFSSNSHGIQQLSTEVNHFYPLY